MLRFHPRPASCPHPPPPTPQPPTLLDFSPAHAGSYNSFVSP
jgi:hypothetical protein